MAHQLKNLVMVKVVFSGRRYRPPKSRRLKNLERPGSMSYAREILSALSLSNTTWM
jgi:hypothetical protein